MHYDTALLERIIDFIHSIGIAVIETELDETTFLPGLELKGSTILLDRKRLKYPGDLLHEAGHIAVTEEHLRAAIGTPKMGSDWPSDGDEIASIIWSYAALHHLQLAPEVVFHPHGYKNQSEWLVEQFTTGNYVGLPLLQWMGFCADPKEFPVMGKWLR